MQDKVNFDNLKLRYGLIGLMLRSDESLKDRVCRVGKIDDAVPAHGPQSEYFKLPDSVAYNMYNIWFVHPSFLDGLKRLNYAGVHESSTCVDFLLFVKDASVFKGDNELQTRFYEVLKKVMLHEISQAAMMKNINVEFRF